MSYKPTVMPKDESLYKQKEQLGAPGIQLPTENTDLGAVRDVNAQDLNARLQSEDEARSNARSNPHANTPGLQRVEADTLNSLRTKEARNPQALNEELQAQDEARRNPHAAAPGIANPQQFDAFKK